MRQKKIVRGLPAPTNGVEFSVLFEDTGDRMVLSEQVARRVIASHVRRKVRLESRPVGPWQPVK